jgi:hypothetical protein
MGVDDVLTREADGPAADGCADLLDIVAGEAFLKLAMDGRAPQAVGLAAYREGTRADHLPQLVDEAALVDIGLVRLQDRLDDGRIGDEVDGMKADIDGHERLRGRRSSLEEEGERVTPKCGKVRKLPKHR